MKLHIGCGEHKLTGYINIDINSRVNPDRIIDLSKFPWPFQKNSVDKIYGEQTIEHLGNLTDVMKEIHRVLKPGGELKAIVPHFTWNQAFADPTHTTFFGWNTFDYFAEYSTYTSFKFKIKSKKLIFGKKLAVWNYVIEPLANIFPHLYENTPLRMFPAESIEVVMIK